MLNCRISLIVYPCCNKILAPDKPDKGLTVADSPHSSTANITQPRVSALIFSSFLVFHSYLIKKSLLVFKQKANKVIICKLLLYFLQLFYNLTKTKKHPVKNFNKNLYSYFCHLVFAKIKQKLINQHLSNPFQIRFGFLKKKS